MTTMIEKVARALCEAAGNDPDHLEPGDALGIDGYKANGDPAHFYWRHYTKPARAAIEAMREPTVEMLRAADNTIIDDEQFHSGPYEHAKAEWKAMISAALTEKDQP